MYHKPKQWHDSSSDDDSSSSSSSDSDHADAAAGGSGGVAGEEGKEVPKEPVVPLKPEELFGGPPRILHKKKKAKGKKEKRPSELDPDCEHCVYLQKLEQASAGETVSSPSGLSADASTHAGAAGAAGGGSSA